MAAISVWLSPTRLATLDVTRRPFDMRDMTFSPPFNDSEGKTLGDLLTDAESLKLAKAIAAAAGAVPPTPVRQSPLPVEDVMQMEFNSAQFLDVNYRARSVGWALTLSFVQRDPLKWTYGLRPAHTMPDTQGRPFLGQVGEPGAESFATLQDAAAFLDDMGARKTP